LPYPPFHPARSQETLPLTFSPADFDREFPVETGYVERKQGTSGLDEAIVAFSNADGGVVLIGVADDGTVHGRELTAGLETDLHRIVSTTRDPGRYFISPASVGSKHIVVLAIARRHAGFSQTSNGRVLVRRGQQNLALMGGDLAQFIMQRALTRFESTEVSLRWNDAPLVLRARVQEAFGWESPEVERFQEQGLVTPGNSLTVAGALLLVPEPDRVLGKAYVEILRFPPGSSEYDKRVLVRGPVYGQVENATATVMDELGVDMAFLRTRRYELPRLPEIVVREAIANAVGHRQYETTGVPVRIELRPEAVQIESPGSLPEPVTEANIRDAQSARNLVVMSVLRRFRLAEDAGRGVRVMQDTMERELLDRPRFSDLGHAVRVHLPLGGTITPTERAWLHQIEAGGLITAEDRVLVVHAARGETLNNARVRELLNVGRSEATEALRRVRNAGLIRQLGQRGGATYRIEPRLAPQAAVRLGDEELKDFVLQLAAAGPLTNERVRDETGLDRGDALRMLSVLVAEGKLLRRGTRRGTHYVQRFPQAELAIEEPSG